MINDNAPRPMMTPATDFPTESFDDAADAVERLAAIYDANTSFLRDAFEAAVGGIAATREVRRTAA